MHYWGGQRGYGAYWMHVTEWIKLGISETEFETINQTLNFRTSFETPVVSMLPLQGAVQHTAIWLSHTRRHTHTHSFWWLYDYTLFKLSQWQLKRTAKNSSNLGEWDDRVVLVDSFFYKQSVWFGFSAQDCSCQIIGATTTLTSTDPLYNNSMLAMLSVDGEDDDSF